jgi:hypothetical protein
MRMLLPRRSVRLRLTALYGALFLLSGAVLLAITSGVVVAQSSATAPAPPAGQQDPQSALGRAQARIQLQASWRLTESRISFSSGRRSHWAS